LDEEKSLNFNTFLSESLSISNIVQTTHLILLQ